MSSFATPATEILEAADQGVACDAVYEAVPAWPVRPAQEFGGL